MLEMIAYKDSNGEKDDGFAHKLKVLEERMKSMKSLRIYDCPFMA